MRGRRVDTPAERIIALAAAGLTNQQIADRLGCTVRTLDRRRAADPALTEAIKDARAELVELRPCGTTAAYRRGCHCDDCRAANAEARRQWDLRNRQRRGLPPPNPRRGRQPTRRIATSSPATQRVRIEQAIANGKTTTWIMDAFDCDYRTVKTIRDAMSELAAS